MCKTARLVRYFELIEPGGLVTYDEIIALLWRGDPNGGPLNISNSIQQQFRKAKQAYPHYQFECVKQWGYRMTQPKAR